VENTTNDMIRNVDPGLTHATPAIQIGYGHRFFRVVEPREPRATLAPICRLSAAGPPATA
ncbi:hypothetical protein, partial [Sphingomonas sp.]|uniref:hypothetical protein n=1 Tax=Sphingomonas sp. TaxID=28214 RepID=UPI003B00C653